MAFPDEDPARLGALLGFDLDPETAEPAGPSAEPSGDPRREAGPAVPARTWRLVGRRHAERLPVPAPPPSYMDRSPLDEAGDPTRLPPTPLAVPWRRLEARLRDGLRTPRRGVELDLPRVVERLSRGRPLDPLPRRSAKAWPTRLHLWLDGSRQMLPLWPDQVAVALSLQRILGKGELRMRVLRDGPARDEELPSQGEVLLVVGGLGLGTPDQARWQRLGLSLRRAGVHAVALLPFPRDCVQRHLRQAYRVVPWQAEARVRDRATAVDRLLVCCAPARLLHPGLVRAIRSLLPADQADLGTELELWQDPRLLGAGASGAVLDGELCASLRARFAREVAAELQRQVRDTVEHWHEAMPPELRHAETLGWQHTPGLSGPPPGDPDGARAWLCALRHGMGVGSSGDPLLALLGQGLVAALPDQALQKDPDLRAIYRQVASRERQGRVRLPEAELLPPGTVGSAWSLRLVGDQLRFAPSPQAEDLGLVPLQPGSPLARARAGSHVAMGKHRHALGTGLDLPLPRQDRLELDLGPEVLTLQRAEVPSWATAWGRDRYGLWAQARIAGVTQRFRWISPGRFLMGSPTTEEGRFDSEVQHPVTLTQGYWMGETPVTQDLWRAVMRDDPSHFKGGQHPVEKVSWNRVLEFLDQLDADVHLPTEAEWEFACRADADGPPWAGAGSEDELDRVAWFSKNSDWTTHPVGEKAPNHWGLHDMLGNVWEWCADGWQAALREPATDPWAVEALYRVYRGGACYDPAQSCRAAYRFADPPSDAWDSLGFRLARGPALESRKEALRRKWQGGAAEQATTLHGRAERGGGGRKR